MTKDNESSISEFVVEQVGTTVAPMAEAARVRAELGVCCWDETCSAVERAGIQIVRADLPPAVRGFATVVDGQPYIVTNRCDSPEEQRYTVSHEFGHHVLGHLKSSSSVLESGLGNSGIQDLQADQFAVAWLIQTAKTERHREFLRSNSSANATLGKSAIIIGLVLVASLLFYLLASLFAKNSVA